MTIEEETISRSGVETLPDESGSPTLLTGKPAGTQTRSWGDYMAGVGENN